MRDKILIGAAVGAGVVGGLTALMRRRQQMPMEGKVVLITGGSRGLGLAMAREYAAQGCRIALCARNEAELHDAAADLASRGASVFTATCDVADRLAVEEMIARVTAHYGHIDVLVNNAGEIRVAPVDAVTIDDFEQAMDVMFWGTVYTTMAALPLMKERACGRIVNITSIGAKVSVPHLLPYSCAKFAAAAFSEGLGAELRPHGIRVVTIAPGLMRTGSFLNAIFKGDREREAVWFSAAASLPGISISAKRAARQIVSATRSGRAERILSTPANLLALFHGVFPGLTTEILALVNRVLPKGTDREAATGAETEVLKKRWMTALTTLGRSAAREYHQPAIP